MAEIVIRYAEAPTMGTCPLCCAEVTIARHEPYLAAVSLDGPAPRGSGPLCGCCGERAAPALWTLLFHERMMHGWP